MRGAEVVAEEREIISRELAVGSSFRSIGRLLKRDHSVVSREVARNGGRSAYRVIPAQRRADEHRARPKPRLLEKNTALHDAVNSGLEQKWSPKQISKRLRQDFPDDDTMRVSHETIYESLYLQARGELRTQLKIALRQVPHQPAHDRRLPRHLPTTAGLRLAHHRHPTDPASPLRSERPAHRGVPATSGDRAGQRRRHPQRPAGHHPLPVPLRGPARTRRP